MADQTFEAIERGFYLDLLKFAVVVRRNGGENENSGEESDRKALMVLGRLE
jgi:hypothetical protein